MVEDLDVEHWCVYVVVHGSSIFACESYELLLSHVNMQLSHIMAGAEL